MKTALGAAGTLRTNVQWYLEGNTPNQKSEATADLAVALKSLAIHIAEQGEVTAYAGQLREFCKDVTRQQLEEVGGLSKLVALLRAVAEKKDNRVVDSRPFREAVVQLIVVAESSADLQVRRMVLELVKGL